MSKSVHPITFALSVNDNLRVQMRTETSRSPLYLPRDSAVCPDRLWDPHTGGLCARHGNAPGFFQGVASPSTPPPYPQRVLPWV